MGDELLQSKRSYREQSGMYTQIRFLFVELITGMRQTFINKRRIKMSEGEKMKIVSKADANAILRHLVRKGVPVETRILTMVSTDGAEHKKEYIGKEVQKVPWVLKRFM